MTREQTEKKIRDKFGEILKIYKEYNPEDEFLELVYIDNTIFFIIVIGKRKTRLIILKVR